LAKKTTPEEIVTERGRLIQKIADTEKEEKEKQEKYEKEIQVKIDNAQRFIKRTLALSAEKSNELLEELKDFRRDYGFSSVPAKYHAFLSKNKENAFDKLIADLRLRILKEETIRLIKRELEDLDQEEKKRHPLVSFHLEDKYNDFERKIRAMSNSEEINEYENGMIKSISILRPVRVSLNEIYELAEKSLDDKDDSQETQKIRENILDYLLDLERYKNTPKSKNATVWLIYIKERSKIDILIGDLLKKIREQGSNSLTEQRDLIKEGKEGQTLNFIDREFNSYRRLIVNRSTSQDLKNQRYEKEFREKIKNHFEQQSQSQREQTFQAQTQQNIPPK
jgi:hypothetical protein